MEGPPAEEAGQQEEVGQQCLPLPDHHIQLPFCHTRPPYRDPNKPRAVKVYTVSQESLYIIVFNIPTIGVEEELALLLSNSSTLDRFEKFTRYEVPEFTCSYLLHYSSLSSARYVKRKFDNYYFYGSYLHLSYAPELETPPETLQKLTSFRQSYNRAVRSLTSTCRTFTSTSSRGLHEQSKFKRPRRKRDDPITEGDEGNAVESAPPLSRKPDKTPTVVSRSSAPISTGTVNLIANPNPQPGQVTTSTPCSYTQRLPRHMIYSKSRFVGIPRQVRMKIPPKPTNYLISKEVLETASPLTATLRSVAQSVSSDGTASECEHGPPTTPTTCRATSHVKPRKKRKRI